MGLFDGGLNPGGIVGGLMGAGASAAGPAGLLAGSFLGNQAGNALGLGGPAGPNVPAPSSELQGRMTSLQSNLNKSPEEVQQRTLQNTQNAAGALGYDPTNTALSHRASRIFNTNMNDLSTKALISSQLKSNEMRGNALDYGTQLRNFQRGVDFKVQDLQMQAESSRNALLGQLFGGLGSGIGSVAAMSKNRPSSMSPSVDMVPAGAGSASLYNYGGTYSGPGYTT